MLDKLGTEKGADMDIRLRGAALIQSQRDCVPATKEAAVADAANKGRTSAGAREVENGMNAGITAGLFAAVIAEVPVPGPGKGLVRGILRTAFDRFGPVGMKLLGAASTGVVTGVAAGVDASTSGRADQAGKVAAEAAKAEIDQKCAAWTAK